MVSIFVNPMQFGAGEDLDRYPRTFDADLALCAEQGVDIVFAPSVEEVYPGGDPQVTVEPGPLASVLEGVVPAHPLPRRADRRRQAVRPGAARRGRVRREGLPAAGADPADGLRPVHGRRRRRRRHRPRGTTAWRCPAATATSTRTSAGAPSALSRTLFAARDAAKHGADAALAAARHAAAARPRCRPRLPRADRPRPRTGPGLRPGPAADRRPRRQHPTDRQRGPHAERPSRRGEPDAAHHDEEQDPPRDGDAGRPALRRLGHRRRGPARGGRPAAR